MAAENGLLLGVAEGARGASMRPRRMAAENPSCLMVHSRIGPSLQ